LVNLLFPNQTEKWVQKIVINKYITDSIFYISIWVLYHLLSFPHITLQTG
jgi:hypothetical protein